MNSFSQRLHLPLPPSHASSCCPISLTFKGSDSGSQGAATWRTGRIAFPEVNLGALGRTTDHRDSVVWDASRMAAPAEATGSCDSGTCPSPGAAGAEAEVRGSPPSRGVQACRALRFVPVMQRVLHGCGVGVRRETILHDLGGMGAGGPTSLTTCEQTSRHSLG